jgi:flagellar biosynthesis/type III secretory pathway protein FliH
MSDEFVPLELFLRPPRQGALKVVEPLPLEPAAEEFEETIRAARRFRAALADAVDIAVARLLPEIARDVLARELRLAPADVAAIAAAALERFAGEKILALRVHPADADALAELPIAVALDSMLHRGDAVLELQSGTIDLRMDVRMSALLGACA